MSLTCASTDLVRSDPIWSNPIRFEMASIRFVSILIFHVYLFPILISFPFVLGFVLVIWNEIHTTTSFNWLGISICIRIFRFLFQLTVSITYRQTTHSMNSLRYSYVSENNIISMVRAYDKQGGIHDGQIHIEIEMKKREESEFFIWIWRQGVGETKLKCKPFETRSLEIRNKQHWLCKCMYVRMLHKIKSRTDFHSAEKTLENR